MNLTMRKDATAFGVNTSARFDHARIRALIDEATTDSNDESDEYAGLLSMIQEEVVCPFLIRVQGEDVECVGIVPNCSPDGLTLCAAKCRKFGASGGGNAWERANLKAPKVSSRHPPGTRCFGTVPNEAKLLGC